MKHILAGIVGGCFGFAIARFILGDFSSGWLGILCAIGFFVTRFGVRWSDE